MNKKIKRSLIRHQRAVAPVVATLILIVVAVSAVGSFAFLFSSFQSQAQKQNSQLTNEKNENLKITFLQLYPPNWDTANITGINMTISNLNTSPSGLVGIQINGNYTAFATVGPAALSPYSVLANGAYVPINTTQVIAGQNALQLELNLSADVRQPPIPRTSSISINLVTAAQAIFTFSITPPVAMFNALTLNSNDELLNASGSLSSDTGIQYYNWNFIALNTGGGVNSTSSTLSGRSVQYFPRTGSTLVTLTVVDDYGLVSRYDQVVLSPAQSVGITTFTATTTGTTTPGTPPTCSSPSQDAQLFVCPYLNQIEKVRQVLMTPYVVGRGHYGYDSTLDLTCGGNIEPSPAIGVGGGYDNVCVIVDNNLEGSKSLDYFNSAASILSNTPGWTFANTNIYGQVRTDLGLPWNGIGGCGTPFQSYTYPNSFGGFLDRRESEYGFTDPFATTLIQPGIHIGGIGNNCGTQGQTWYLPSFQNPATTMIVTEFPSQQAPGTNSNLEELSFVIDELYMQCVAGTVPCSEWQAAYRNAMAQYPFGAPRQALHFIQATRATQAWRLTNMTVNGLSPLQMVEITIQQLFTPSSQTGPMGVGGATGPDGGLYQQWGGAGSSDTPEPNFQTMIAFDPNMPDWFTVACYQNSANC